MAQRLPFVFTGAVILLVMAATQIWTAGMVTHTIQSKFRFATCGPERGKAQFHAAASPEITILEVSSNSSFNAKSVKPNVFRGVFPNHEVRQRVLPDANLPADLLGPEPTVVLVMGLAFKYSELVAQLLPRLTAGTVLLSVIGGADEMTSPLNWLPASHTWMQEQHCDLKAQTRLTFVPEIVALNATVCKQLREDTGFVERLRTEPWVEVGDISRARPGNQLKFGAEILDDSSPQCTGGALLQRPPDRLVYTGGYEVGIKVRLLILSSSPFVVFYTTDRALLFSGDAVGDGVPRQMLPMKELAAFIAKQKGIPKGNAEQHLSKEVQRVVQFWFIANKKFLTPAQATFQMIRVHVGIRKDGQLFIAGTRTVDGTRRNRSQRKQALRLDQLTAETIRKQHFYGSLGCELAAGQVLAEQVKVRQRTEWAMLWDENWGLTVVDPWDTPPCTPARCDCGLPSYKKCTPLSDYKSDVCQMAPELKNVK